MATESVSTDTELDLVTSYSLTLASLANNDIELSSAFDNRAAGSGVYVRATLRAIFNWASAPTDQQVMAVWLLYSYDGTNYSDGSGTPIVPTVEPAWIIPIRGVTGTQYINMSTPVRLLAHRFKVAIGNFSGTALNSTGNSLYVELHNRTIA